MSTFVTCWKRTLDESPVAIKLLDEIIVEAKSDLEMSEEQSRFKEHLRQSFELEMSMPSHHFGKSQKHSNESQSSVLLKLKPGLDNDARATRYSLRDHERPDKASLVTTYLLPIDSRQRLRTYMCACNAVADFGYIIIPKRDTAQNAELARPATENNGAVARVACRCALGGTLLPFGVRASHRVHVWHKDTVLRTHAFTQVG